MKNVFLVHKQTTQSEQNFCAISQLSSHQNNWFPWRLKQRTHCHFNQVWQCYLPKKHNAVLLYLYFVVALHWSCTELAGSVTTYSNKQAISEFPWASVSRRGYRTCKCTAFDMEIIFTLLQIKLIFIRKDMLLFYEGSWNSEVACSYIN